jgi:hypothetical protein
MLISSLVIEGRGFESHLGPKTRVQRFVSGNAFFSLSRPTGVPTQPVVHPRSICLLVLGCQCRFAFTCAPQNIMETNVLAAGGDGDDLAVGHGGHPAAPPRPVGQWVGGSWFAGSKNETQPTGLR